MLDEALTFTLLMVLFGTAVWRASFADNCDRLFDREWSAALRGVCCVVVILVHIPEMYSTRVQDWVGSFAFIAVTIFFLLSGYGLTLNKEGEDYLRHFWRNRVVSLGIPMALANLLKACVAVAQGSVASVAGSLVTIDGFVLMMLFCYSAFYAVVRIKLMKKHYIAWICGLNLAISILAYLLEDWLPFTVWPTPCLGFMYGAIIAEHSDAIKQYLNRHRILGLTTLMPLILTCLVGIGYIRVKSVSFFGDYLLRSALALGMVWLIVSVLAKFRPNNKAIHTLGSISYEVYLVHGSVIGVLKILALNIVITPGIFILGSVLLSIAVAYLLNRLDRVLIRRLRVGHRWVDANKII